MSEQKSLEDRLAPFRFLTERLPALGDKLTEQSFKITYQLGIWLVVGNILAAVFAINSCLNHLQDADVPRILQLCSGYGLGALFSFGSLYLSATSMALIAARITKLEALVYRYVAADEAFDTWNDALQTNVKNPAPQAVVDGLNTSKEEIQKIEKLIKAFEKPHWLALIVWSAAFMLSIGSIASILLTSKAILDIVSRSLS